MGMDRRLRPGSKPLRNQCRGTGVRPQVYKSKKSFKERVGGEGERQRSRNRGKTNRDHSFPLSQLKTPFGRLLVFNLQKKAARARLMLRAARSDHTGRLETAPLPRLPAPQPREPLTKPDTVTFHA